MENFRPAEALCDGCRQLRQQPQRIVLPDHLRASSAGGIFYNCVDCEAVWLYNADPGWFVRYFESRVELPSQPSESY
jgi:hypothetical protein